MITQPEVQSLIIQIVFGLAVALIAYIYIGYPVLAFVLSRLLPHPVRRAGQAGMEPPVSVVIAAYNEELAIADKIKNTLALEYPREKLEIVVASDCSTDDTDEIVREFASQGVILHRQPERHGKTMAQHRAVRSTSGEILVFSDATTMYEPDAIRQIVRSFADPEVGCVAGQLEYVDRSASAIGQGCRSYWGYEKFLKNCESRMGSLIGVSGCLYAVRRSCHAKLAGDMIDDFVIATEIRRQGLRTVYEPQAVSTEDTNNRTRDEFRMRVRVIKQTITALYRYREVLNPLHYGMFAFQMVSHKVLRYVVPFLLIIAFVANLLLLQTGGVSQPYLFDFYLYAFIGQSLMYIAAMVGVVGERLGLKLGPLAIPYYFVLVNLASLVAFLKFLRGEAYVVWEPIRDVPASGAMRVR